MAAVGAFPKLRPPFAARREKWYTVGITFSGAYEWDRGVDYPESRKPLWGEIKHVEFRTPPFGYPEFSLRFGIKGTSEPEAVRLAIELLEGQGWAYRGLLDDADTCSILVERRASIDSFYG